VQEVLKGSPKEIFQDFEKLKKYDNGEVVKIIKHPYLVNDSKIYLSMYAFMSSFRPFKLKIFGEPIVDFLIS